MPNRDEVIASVERNLVRMHEYTHWKIGLAADAEARQRELDYPSFWRYWHADTIDDARAVISHFVDKGMKSDGEHGKTPSYVYLF